MANVLLVLTLPEPVRRQYLERLREAFPDVKLDMVDHHSKVDPYIGAADVLITFGVQVAPHVFDKAKRLKWVQALGTGVDGIVDQPALGKDVVVTNMHLPRSMRLQRAHRWERFPASLLKDRTVGIFGVGAIALELAPKCKAFGMRVVGITSHRRDLPGFDAMVDRGALERAVSDLDFLVLLTPYSEATRNIVNARIFAAMKPGACLVNLARGGIVDEAALVDALRAKKLAAAALDVFAEEPLPADSPLWDMDNVLVTQHQGGFFDAYPRYALPVVEENMRRWLAGDVAGMVNVVRH
jgi:phosphoglycerate dehydrogenase-like enzyme